MWQDIRQIPSRFFSSFFAFFSLFRKRGKLSAESSSSSLPKSGRSRHIFSLFFSSWIRRVQRICGRPRVVQRGNFSDTYLGRATFTSFFVKVKVWCIYLGNIELFLSQKHRNICLRSPLGRHLFLWHFWFFFLAEKMWELARRRVEKKARHNYFPAAAVT